MLCSREVGRLGRAVRKKLKQFMKAQHYQQWQQVCDSSIYPFCCLLPFLYIYFFPLFLLYIIPRESEGRKVMNFLKKFQMDII